MKTVLSISFIAIVLIVMIVGFYETAYAGPECASECLENGICTPSTKTCNFTFYCDGPHYFPNATCSQFFYDYCCENGCPC